MAKSARKRSPSTIVNRTVPRRAPNSELRPREYLTEKEIERLQEAARKRSRYGHRDATMILVAYRHALRASEVCGLRWDQIELNSGRLHVQRAKGGIDNVHPLSGKEIRALRQLRRENIESRYVFVTERGGPATTAGFLKTIARTGEAAKLPFPIHPHMLRHSTGYKLANDGHDTRALQHYMGHKNSCTRFDTPRWRLIGLRISGRTDTLSQGFSHFVTSMTAPVASGGSGCRVGLAPTGKAPPLHGAREKRTLRGHCECVANDLACVKTHCFI